MNILPYAGLFIVVFVAVFGLLRTIAPPRRKGKPFRLPRALPGVQYSHAVLESDALLAETPAAQANDIVEGRILFNPPTTMKQGVAETVTVRITKDLADAALKQLHEQVQGRGDVTVDKIAAGSYMRVNLSGDGFTVTQRPPAPGVQAILDHGYAEWLFTVLPEDAGPQKLYLQVAMEYTVSKDFVPSWQTVMHREITVQVSPLWWVRNIVSNHIVAAIISFIATTIVTALGWKYGK